MTKLTKRLSKAQLAVQSSSEPEKQVAHKSKRLPRLLSGKVKVESFQAISDAFDAEPDALVAPADKAREIYSQIVVTAYRRGFGKKEIRAKTAELGYSVSLADISRALAESLERGVDEGDAQI